LFIESDDKGAGNFRSTAINPNLYLPLGWWIVVGPIETGVIDFKNILVHINIVRETGTRVNR